MIKMVSMSLTSLLGGIWFASLSSAKRHHKRDEDEYLSISRHFCVCCFLRAEGGSLLVQDNSQEGRIDVNTAVVGNEAQSPEFVHEEINSGPGRPNDFRQSLLRYLGHHFLRLVLITIASEQQKSTS